MLRGKGCQSNGGRFYLLEALRVLAEGPAKRRRRIAYSKPKLEGAIRQGRGVRGMRLVPRLASYAIPDDQGARKTLWTTGKKPQ